MSIVAQRVLTPAETAAMAYAVERVHKRREDEATIRQMGRMVTKFNDAVTAYVATNPSLSAMLHKQEFVTNTEIAISRAASAVVNHQIEISTSYEHAIEQAIQNDASSDEIETLRDQQQTVCARLEYMPAELNIAKASRLIPQHILSGIFYQADPEGHMHSIGMRKAGFQHTADILVYQVALIADGIHPVPQPQ